MTRIEKPLNRLQLPELSHKEVATAHITVRFKFHYNAFLHISPLVASRFTMTTPPSSSGIRLHPNYDRTQNDSMGSTDLYISFSSLSDLMDLLGVNDEDENEKILCTEVNTTRHTLMKIIGTLTFPDSTIESARSCHTGSTTSALRLSTSSSNQVGNSPEDLFDRTIIYLGT